MNYPAHTQGGTSNLKQSPPLPPEAGKPTRGGKLKGILRQRFDKKK